MKMKEIIVWRYRSYLSGQQVTQWQVSNEDGIFANAHLSTTHDEMPAVMLPSLSLELGDKIRYLDEATKTQVLAISQQIEELRQKREQLIQQNFDTFPLVTWEWMKQHQKPELTVPEPYKHMNIIKSLRRGSKLLVDGSQDAVKWGLALKKAKLKKKSPKYAVVEIERQLYRLPYYVLLPYSQQALKTERQNAKRNRQLVNHTKKLNKVLKGVA